MTLSTNTVPLKAEFLVVITCHSSVAMQYDSVTNKPTQNVPALKTINNVTNRQNVPKREVDSNTSVL